MPGLTSYDIVGAKEDVSDIITNLTPTRTPFQSLIGPEKIKARIKEWQEDALADVADNAAVEGADAVNNTLTPTVMRQNNTQILTKAVQIAGTTDAVSTYGRAKETAYQLRKKSQEIKRDLEHALVGTGQVAVLGSSSVARKMAGVQAQINAGVTTTASANGPLTEALFMTANQKLYDAGSEAVTLMVKPTDSVRVGSFVTAAGRTRDIGQGKKIVNVIDVLVTPFGEQKVVMNRFLKKTDALLVDADNWKLMTLRPWTRETLAKNGDSERYMLLGEFSLKHNHRDATGLITGLDVS
jgi:hypothetical protein